MHRSVHAAYFRKRQGQDGAGQRIEDEFIPAQIAVDEYVIRSDRQLSTTAMGVICKMQNVKTGRYQQLTQAVRIRPYPKRSQMLTSLSM